MNNSEAENVDTLIYNVRVATMAAENPSDYAAVSAIAVSKGKARRWLRASALSGAKTTFS